MIAFNGAMFMADADGFIHGYSDAGKLPAEHNLYDGTDKTAEGIYFADNHVANTSAVIEDVTDINVAELVASNHLISTADQSGIKKLKIHTDSANLIDAVVKMDEDFFAFQEKNRCYRKNPEQYDKVFVNVIAPGREVSWIKVKAHNGNLTLKGNKEADKQATAALRPFKVPPSTPAHVPVHQVIHQPLPVQQSSGQLQMGPPKKKRRIIN